VIRADLILGSRLHPATGRDVIYVAAVLGFGLDVAAVAPGEVIEARWLTFAEAVRLMPDMHHPVRAYLAARAVR
jgi:hypothetical protein